jgi:phosphomannomutase
MGTTPNRHWRRSVAPRRIRFGTDGWRAIIGDDYTYENVGYCAQGWADYLRSRNDTDRGVVVGYDKRFGSEHFASRAAEVLAGNGIRAYLCDTSPPTPVISYAIVTLKAAGGVTITASHNPADYNGFKVRSDYGGAIMPEVISQLEKHIDAAQDRGAVQRMGLDAAKESDLVRMIDPGPAYATHLGDLIDVKPLRDAGLRVANDCMYGAGIGWFRRLIGDGATRIIAINAERNPYFGGIAPEPIPRNMQRLFETTRSERASVGLATDGDADRLGVCDEHGEIIDQLRVYSLIALYLLEVRGFRGPIVKTLSTSSMLDKLGQLYGVPVIETGVGFKYVAPAMMEHDAMVGGEESGGYAFRNHLPERDGLLAGLFILDLIVKMGKQPSELVEFLFSKVGPHYYDRLDIQFPAADRPAILERLDDAHPDTIAGDRVEAENRTDGFKYVLRDGSWLLIRFSGTEPIMRVYTETGSKDRVQAILAAGRRLAGV